MRIAIIPKKDSPKAERLAKNLKTWLKRKGLQLIEEKEIKKALREKELDLLVILGGDGTLLYATSLVGESGVPILGVNVGGLGFLTEVKVKEAKLSIEKFFAGKLAVEERMLIQAKVLGREKTYLALNEFVLARSYNSKIVDVVVYVDGYYLATFRADGLIVSSPTGSTAYALAGGGPIVHPKVSAILLVPICAHTLTSRPLMVPSSSVIRIEVSGKKDGKINLIGDGKKLKDLSLGERLEISSASSPLRLVSSPSLNYYEILRTKLGWGG